MKVTAYAVSEDGDGFVSKLGEWGSFSEMSEDFSIRCGMFAPDVVISFEVDFEDEDGDYCECDCDDEEDDEDDEEPCCGGKCESF